MNLPDFSALWEARDTLEELEKSLANDHEIHRIRGSDRVSLS